jgi:hypothetical protein
MGPQKMAYVMDYLAITFPKIKSNQYLYNIAEAAVFELNKEKEEAAAQKEFEEKYGELPKTESSTQTDSLVEKAAEVLDNNKEVISEVVIVADTIKEVVTPATKPVATSKATSTKASISSF